MLVDTVGVGPITKLAPALMSAPLRTLNRPILLPTLRPRTYKVGKNSPHSTKVLV